MILQKSLIQSGIFTREPLESRTEKLSDIQINHIYKITIYMYVRNILQNFPVIFDSGIFSETIPNQLEKTVL